MFVIKLTERCLTMIHSLRWNRCKPVQYRWENSLTDLLWKISESLTTVSQLSYWILFEILCIFPHVGNVYSQEIRNIVLACQQFGFVADVDCSSLVRNTFFNIFHVFYKRFLVSLFWQWTQLCKLIYSSFFIFLFILRSYRCNWHSLVIIHSTHRLYF